MPAVTISAGYGAGGSVIAPAVAQQLGLSLLDRAISAEVAMHLKVSVAEAAEGAAKQSAADRLFSLLRPLAGGVLGAAAAPPEPVAIPADADEFRAQAERIMRQALPAGAVILGRAGAAALRDEPLVLRVRLFGPPDRCIARAIRFEHVDEATARERIGRVNAARRAYVHRLYRMDIDDPALFHLQIDTTVVPVATATTMIVEAYRGLLSTDPNADS